MGLSFSLGAICLAGLGHFVLALYLNQQNKKRDSMSEEKRTQAIEQGKNAISIPTSAMLFNLGSQYPFNWGHASGKNIVSC